MSESCPKCGGPLTVRTPSGRVCAIKTASCEYAASLRTQRDKYRAALDRIAKDADEHQFQGRATARASLALCVSWAEKALEDE